MSELDDRVSQGLRELVERAPVDADVWDETSRYVAKHRRRRQATIASIGLAVVAALGIGVAANAARGGRRSVSVAVRPTVPPPSIVTTPISVAPTAPATSPTTTAAASKTTTTTAPVHSAPPDACPFQCVGKSDADVDGDGRVDHIGYMQSQALGADMKGAVKVRVVFADGRVAEFDDSEQIYAAWLGAADVNGDGKAELFYMNDAGAHYLSGYVLRWDGTRLVKVTADGKPLAWTVDGYAFGDTGFRCTANTIVFTSVSYQGSGDGSTGPYSGPEDTYAWQGPNLVKTSTRQVTVEGRAGATKVYGAHCPGLPLAPDSLIKP